MESKWITYRGLTIECHPVDGFTVWDERLAPLGRRRFIDYTYREAWEMVTGGGKGEGCVQLRCRGSATGGVHGVD